MKIVDITCDSVLSDKWIDQPLMASLNKVNGRMKLDLSNVEWVELGALVALSAIIVKHIRNFPQIDILIQLPDDCDTKNYNRISRSFQFLIRSQFLVAIRDAHNQAHIKDNAPLPNFEAHKFEMADLWDKPPPIRSEDECGVWLWLSLSQGTKDETLKLSKKLRTRFEGEVSRKLNRDVVIFDYLMNQRPAIRMKIDALPALLLSLPQNFSEHTLLTDPSSDVFILPISYFSCNEHIDFVRKREEESNRAPQFSVTAPTFIDNELYASAQFFDEPIREQVLNSVRFWLTELLYNIVDHGGDDGIYCCRLGDALLRSKPDARNNFSHSYSFREDFFRTAADHSFIDVCVADTGEGFESLERAYLSGKKRKDKIPLSILHRFSLYPDSTSKAYAEDMKLQPRMTGLGVIAQDVRAKAGMIYIRDKIALTSFTTRSLAQLFSPESALNSHNLEDLNVTLISALMSLPNERWIRQKELISLDLDIDNEGEEILYVDEPTLLAPATDIEDQSCVILSNKIIKQKVIHREKFGPASEKVPRGTLCLIDLSTYPNFLKDQADRLIRNIIHLRTKGVFVVVYCTDVSAMSLLELSWETRKTYLYDYMKRKQNLSPERLIFPVITSDFELYVCGDLPPMEQAKIAKALAGEAIKISKRKRDELGLQNQRLPVRLLERAINRMRGHFFLRMLSRDHYVESMIMDTHGAILDRYFEVKPYLNSRENRHHYLPDIRRYIKKYQPAVIIVDSVELKLLVQEAIALFPHPNIEIGRFHEENMQFDQDSDYTNRSCMLLLAAAHSGGVLNAVSDISERFSLEINTVVCLLDLTGQSSSRNSKDISGQEHRVFDRLSVAEPPARISTNETCNYFATTDGRLIANEKMYGPSVSLFKAEHTSPLFMDEIQHESQSIYPDSILTVGHSEVQGHHYDVLLDVRKALSSMTPSAHRFVYLVQMALRKSKATICFYPEESELSNILDSVHYVGGNKTLEKIELSKVDHRLVCSRKHSLETSKDKHILFLDEGVYSSSTLLVFLETIAFYQPASITVVVMEVRLTRNSRIGSLQSFIDRHGTQIHFEFFTVYDFGIRCWIPSDCPYCNANIGLQNHSPLSLPKGFLIENTPIEFESTFVAWFLKKLYSDRAQAFDAIQFCIGIGGTYSQIRFIACVYLLIHFEQASKLNLRENVITIFRNSLATPKTERIGYLLHILNDANVTSKYKFVQHAFEITQNKIGENAIYREFIRIVRRRPTLKKVIEEKLSSRSVATGKAWYWKQVINADDSCSHSEALKGILTLTKLCRENHKKLSDRILERRREDIALDIDISRLKEFFSFLNTTDQIDADQEILTSFRNPHLLATVLNNEKWKEEFLQHKVTTTFDLLSILTSSLSDITQLDQFDLSKFPGCTEPDTIQLALGASERYYLVSYIKDNILAHGQSTITASIDDDDFRMNLDFGLCKHIDLTIANSRARELLPLTRVGASVEYFSEHIDGERRNFYSHIRIKIVGHTLRNKAQPRVENEQ